MQSLLRQSLNTPQQQTVLTSKTKTVSIIPKISQANNLLPSNFSSSKPPSHLFKQGFHDIKAESSSMHKLYDSNQNFNKLSQISPIFSLQFHQKDQANNKRKSQNQSKFKNLKHFLLQESQNILFLSRSICLILNQEENKIFSQLTSFNFKDSSNNDQKQIQSHQNKIKKLSQVLLQNQNFPFLCPQLNQTFPQNSSFQNFSLQSSQECLVFNDNFQSSNIMMVKKVQNFKPQKPIYCICTRFDYQTASYGQWFYFSVEWPQNLKQKQASQKQSFNIKKRKFKFMICNMTKQYSLFGNCMKISVCRDGVWGKQGQSIRYYETIFYRSNKVQNQINNINLSKKKNHQFYFALEFELEIRKGQKIYVSYNEPYTVTKLSNLLDNFHKNYAQVQSNSQKTNKSQKSTTQNSQTDNEMNFNRFQKNTSKQPVYYKKQIICETPLNNQIFCLTFSMRKQFAQKTFIQQSLPNQQEISDKKIIFILARAHPIETAGSFVIEGILKTFFLFAEYKNSIKKREDLKHYFQGQSKGKLLQNLLKKFIVKIIPLINPDGVIIGNSRCNFYGYDLNRQWKRSNKILSKQIFSLKRFLLKYKGRIQMVIDLHGHSKEKNVFAYGMHDFRDPFVTRQFPFILSKLVTHNFSFNQCKFTRLKNPTKQRASIEKKCQILNSKQGTARIWLFRKLSIPNIFTIENSYCGSTNSQFHYDSVSYNQIGKQILLGMCMYYLNYSQKRQQKVQNNDQKYEGRAINNPMNKNFGLEELMRLKDSLILDLKQNQLNASIGLDDINSSQSQEECRIQDEIKQNKTNGKSPEKRKISSPNKLKYSSALKNSFQPQQKSDINKKNLQIHRYSNNQKSQGEQVYNFRYKFNPKNQNDQKNQNFSSKQRIVALNRRYSRRQLNSQSKLRFQQLQYHKKSLSNYKSTSELQRNTALSIVEVGWDQDKLIEGKICETQRVFSNDNDWLNFPQINSPSINNAIFTHRSNLNLKYKQLNNANNSTNPNCSKKVEIKIDKPQLQGLPQNNLKNAQLKKNVNEFIKKLQSNRKLQNEIVMTRKIQKYKQIIMKINGNQNN